MPFPSPLSKKERLARFISRLKNRADQSSSGSSLVVQTGFPTSLADLVVKNRAKFRKRKPKPSTSSDIDSNASVAVRSQSYGSDHPPTAAVVQIPIRIEGKRRGIGLLGLGFVALVVLTVGMRWIVAGITVLTVGLLVLELLGVVKPRSKGRNCSENLIERAEFEFDLRGREVVSPIREIEELEGTDDGLVEIEGNVGNSESLDSKRDVLLEMIDIDGVDNVNRKSKRKNIFRKLFRKKNSQKKNDGITSREEVLIEGQGGVSSHLGDNVSSCDVDEVLIGGIGEISLHLGDSITSREEMLIEEDEKGCDGDGDGDGDKISKNCDEECISYGASDEISEVKTEDVNVVKDGGEIRMRWRILVFVIIVLLGLLRGKVVALVATLVCYVLSGCTGTLWKKWKKKKID